MECPACGERERTGPTGPRFSAVEAAEHFVPRERDQARHASLLAHLRSLWEQDHVEIWGCAKCTFGFAVPWVGGDAAFYAIAHEGDAHYPPNRWEFDETLAVLGQPAFRRPLRVVEVGAGDGAFLDRLRTLPGAPDMRIVAADYDEGAARRMRAKGYDAFAGSLRDVVDRREEPFDVICLFQTLEHMADLEDVFDALHSLLRRDGHVFLSVPHSAATAHQEATTGLWDMPPNHVGRWNPKALEKAASRYGFTLVESRAQPVDAPRVAWNLAVMKVNGRSYETGTIANRVNGIPSRAIRGTLKRVLALGVLPTMLRGRREFHPQHCWAHLRRNIA
jgi:2-polyprenyl-3-methyl-5-hydroxy-6-metoxy-1,4-benzoquinol methylase